MSLKAFKKQLVTNQSATSATRPIAPVINSFSVSGLDDTALDPAGGQTVLINGNGFRAGAVVYLNTSYVSVVTFVSTNQLSFTSPALSAGTYTLFVTNPDGGTAILSPGLVYSTFPTWTTASGTLGSYYETTAINSTVAATSDSAITYSLVSGSLPTGATLSSSGVITGTAPADTGSTTYSFSVKATDAQLQDSTRSFSLTINTDVVSWTAPANNTNYTVQGYQAIANVTLSATSTANSSYSVSYTANALPTGVSLSGNTISGTPTVAQSVTTLLTATAATSIRSATRTISWSVVLGDTYWNSTTLLLNGSTPTTSFINDASLINNQLTIVGDTRQSNFNPYSNGYYSNYFDGSGDYLSIPSNAAFDFGTGDFTIECWTYPINLFNSPALIAKAAAQGAGVGWFIELAANIVYFGYGTAGGNFATFSVTLGTHAWYHIACTRTGGTLNCFVNGVSAGAATGFGTGSVDNSNPLLIGYGFGNAAYALIGYVSNVRIVKGTLVYTSNFTPSTTPLTTIANTSLLTCQSNSLIDNSNNNFVITKGGDTTVSSFIPFSTPTTVTYNNQYSVYFDGTGDYLSVPTSTALDGFTDFTIEFWVYFSSVSGTQVLLNKGWDAATTFSPYLVYLTGGNIVLYASGGGSWNVASGATIKASPAVNTWYHIAISRSGSSLKLFADGVLTTSATNSTTLLANSSSLLIGATTAGSSTPFATISNLRIIKGTGIYTSAFTPSTSPLTTTSQGATASQVSLLTCQDSTLKDNSTNAFTITSNGQAQPIAVSPFGMTTSNTTATSLGSAYFDGSGDYLTLPASGAFLFGTGNFTIEGWVYITGINGTANGIFQQGTSFPINATTNTVAFGTVTSGQVWQIYANGTNTNSTATWTVNTWYHFAVVRSSNTTKLYINGISVIVVASDTTNYTGTYFGIGALYSTAYTQNGYISDVRVVRGTALYTSNFLPPQTSLTAVTNTQLLTCQYNGGANNNVFVDQSSLNSVTSKNGNTTQGTFSPYSQTGWSNYFNGSSYYSTPAGLKTSMGSGFSGNIITIEAWIYPSTLSGSNTYSGIIGAYAAVAANGRWWFGFSNTGNLTFTFTTSTGSEDSVTATGGGINVNQWHHVAATIDATTNTNTTINLYLNGTRIVNGTGKNLSTQTAYYDAPWLGGNLSQYVNNYTGYISNLRIAKGQAVYTGTSYTQSTTPLVPNQYTVFLTFQNNQIVDNSANQYTITLSGGSFSVQAYGPFGGLTSVPTSYSVYFDGTGDYLSVPANAAFSYGTGDFTYEAWIYPTSYGSGTTYRFICGSGGASQQDQFLINNDGTGKLYYYDGTTAFTTTNQFTLNAWNHVAVSRSSGTLKIFINGTQGASGSSSANLTLGATNVFYIGNRSGGGDSPQQSFIGYISNLRVLKGTGLYTTDFTPATTPLTAVANTSLLTCQSATMIDNSTNYFTITGGGDAKPKPLNPFGNNNTVLVSYAPSVNSGSMYFDGTGDYLSITVPNIFNSSTTRALTIEFWSYATAFGGNFGFFGYGSTSNGYSLEIDTSRWVLKNASGTDSNVYVVGAGTVPMPTVGAWTHYAVVFKATGTVDVIINGVKNAALTGGTSVSSSVSGGTFTIGSAYNNTYLHYGYISDFRVTTGAALYTANFYPGAAPLTSSARLGATTYSSSMLLNGTSGGIIDYHGTNEFETVGNVQLASENPYGGSYYSTYFDGSGDNLTTPNATSAFSFGTGDWTLEFWIRSTMTTRVEPCSWNYTYSSPGWASPLFNTSGGTGGVSGSITWYENSTPVITVDSTGWNDGTWKHFAATRSGNSVRMFLNGTQIGTTYTTSFTYGAANSGMVIGSSSIGNFLAGHISNFRMVKGTAVYTTTFTPPTSPLTAISGTQLLICQSNSIIDNSSNSFAITRSGDTAVKSINPFQNNTGKSLYFDGSGDYLKSPNTPTFVLSNVDFTIEMWVYTTTTANTRRLVAWQNGSSANSNYSYTVDITNADKALGQVFDGATQYQSISSASVNISQWNHIAFVKSGNSFKVYLNGVGATAVTPTTFNAISDGKLYMGMDADGTSYPFTGYITDLRITRGVARYTTTFTPPTSAVQIK